MTNELHRTGTTPYILREAAYYASLGVGIYQPRGQSYDRVSVTIRVPWEANKENPILSSQVIRVEFFRGLHCVRHVEFALNIAGFGGDPILKQV